MFLMMSSKVFLFFIFSFFFFSFSKIFFYCSIVAAMEAVELTYNSSGNECGPVSPISKDNSPIAVENEVERSWKMEVDFFFFFFFLNHIQCDTLIQSEETTLIIKNNEKEKKKLQNSTSFCFALSFFLSLFHFKNPESPFTTKAGKFHINQKTTRRRKIKNEKWKNKGID